MKLNWRVILSYDETQAAALTMLPALAVLSAFLQYHDYPFLGWDVLILVGVIATLALLSGALTKVSRPIAYLIPTASLIVFAEFVFGLSELAARLGWKMATLLALVSLIVATTVIVRVNSPLRKGLIVVLGTILLAQVVAGAYLSESGRVIQERPSGSPRDELPPFIYIVLDSHIGFNGLPKDLPDAAEAHKAMADFFERYGFRVYPAAFSHHMGTAASLRTVLSHAEPLLTPPSSRISTNKLFETLKTRGYRLRVYESNFLEFCNPDNVLVDYCYRYLYDGLAGLKSKGLSEIHKALIIAGTFLQSRPFVRFPRDSINYRFESTKNIPLLGLNALYDTDFSLNAIDGLERLRTDLRTHPKGTAFFGHFLVPHNPYVLNPDCSATAEPRAWSSHEFGVSFLTRRAMSEATREQAYKRYFGQLRCTYRLLDRLMKDLADMGVSDRTTIILHGDHGSRITQYPAISIEGVPNWSRMLRDSFSAMFAVRAPGLTPGWDPVVKPISRLERELIESPERLPLPETDAYFLILLKKLDIEKVQRVYPISPEIFSASAAR